MQCGSCADIDTLRGFVEQKDQRGATKPLAKEHLLLVAAAEGRERLIPRVSRSNLKLLDPQLRFTPLAWSRNEASTPETLQVANRKILPSRQVHDPAVTD